MSPLYQKVVRSPITTRRLTWHADGRGQLMECLRNDSPEYHSDFGQVYMTTVKPGIIKAWHYHNHQTDRMILVKGTVRFVGYVLDEADQENSQVVLDFVVSDRDPYLIEIPSGVYDGFQNAHDSEEAYIMNVSTRAYNHSDPDEVRLSPYDSAIAFNWNIDLHG